MFHSHKFERFFITNTMLKHSQIQSVATLAKLNIDDNIDSISEDLNKFLDLIDTLQDIDTIQVEPMAHPFDGVQRLRTDTANVVKTRDDFQSIAPEVSEGYYLVPKVF